MVNLKEQVGIKAAEFVTDGMIVGLGTGSTAYYFVAELGRRIKEEGLKITAVTTSSVTYEQAEGLGIPLKAIDDVEVVDLTVDGADEVDPALNGIKGGGGALLMEKIVATNSKDCIWIVDESKQVETLGAFKLPVEVVQYGAENLFRHFEKKGYSPAYREKDGQRFVTDQGNFIIDLDLKVIPDAEALAEELDRTVGVVDHGLFLGMVSKVIVGTPEGPKIISKSL
ncbi:MULTISPECIES: ribose-5-phosphate isomerase RpiA [Streptococcus]|nr:MULTISPECIES: ribose-5-phosphate isomerase RpiA [Streptococcus]AMP66558.1 ribose-5-phosphate isomerase [Streptococcus sp. A12]MBZ2159441.1 ribose-5-phosphate isomerase RpiA [Streptococcus australis]MDB8644558.1 ribose-5-phosphate isomerase RpiA [Streptococcus australis]RSJ98652.1 Ribose-5-phosphate isomerase A [Streptococcus australis]RSK01472.1 Ribose-5-phosphate isomerase A [Streptococcus sp. A12]